MAADVGPVIVPERLDGRVLDLLLPVLMALDEDYIRANPRTPLLYESGVRYRREKRKREKWLTIPHVLKGRCGDCEDLACWRAAELRVIGGENARPFWVSRQLSGGTLYHIRVLREDGSVEDPSVVLGMYGDKPAAATRWGRTMRIADGLKA